MCCLDQIEPCNRVQNVLYVTFGAIWYHFCNLKNVKNTHGGVLLLVKLQAFLKVTLLHGCFPPFLNCADGTKSRNLSHICFTYCSISVIITSFYCLKAYRWRGCLKIPKFGRTYFMDGLKALASSQKDLTPIRIFLRKKSPLTICTCAKHHFSNTPPSTIIVCK